MNINDLISGDISKYTPLEQDYINKYRDALREALINALEVGISKKITLDSSFRENIILFGFKGISSLSLNNLIEQVLDVCGEGEFLKLLDKIEI